MFKIHCQLRCRYNGEPDRDDDRIPLLYQSKNIVRRKTYFKVIVLLQSIMQIHLKFKINLASKYWIFLQGQQQYRLVLHVQTIVIVHYPTQSAMSRNVSALPPISPHQTTPFVCRVSIILNYKATQNTCKQCFIFCFI